MKRFLIVAAAALAGISLSSVSRADNLLPGTVTSTPAAPGNVYLSLGGYAGARKMPSWNRTGAIGTSVFAPNNIQATFDPIQFAGGPALTIGYGFRNGLFPAWAGRRVRVELTGSYANGNGSESHSFSLAGPPAQGINIVSVNGIHRFSGVYGVPVTVQERLKVDGQDYAVGLRLASDHHVGRNLYLTTAVGVGGGWNVTRFDFDQSAAFPALGAVPLTVDEKLSSRHFGGDVSLGMTWNATGWLALTVTGRVGVLWRRTKLSARDCVLLAFRLTPCAASPGNIQTTASDTESVFGMRLGLTAGAQVKFWGMMLRVNGFFNWDSATPGIVNPSRTGFVAPGTNIGAARVRHSGGWTSGGIVMLIIPFGYHED